MIKILLACNAGMSTSLLVENMKKAAQEKGLEIEIKAVGASSVRLEMLKEQGWQVVLLGPQVRYELKRIQKAADPIPVDVIDTRDYGLMNGKSVLEKALALLEK
ncbi:PTS sugar transporter subunit IIB [Beduini massiliensis]|uniref:PTS sugar transporter subunit IIB n=1 Tax=Beduini massiliensis TaxID=1585974 RepID=UPI00059A8D0C|nr:PTS sugar transporter subunit IIB [Beduini massiliensis]